jgi:hypothetical protein
MVLTSWEGERKAAEEGHGKREAGTKVRRTAQEARDGGKRTNLSSGAPLPSPFIMDLYTPLPSLTCAVI